MRWLFFITLLTALGSQSCAPVFSELQSARLLKKGQTEITGNYSAVSFSNDGESDKIQNHVGFQLASGISNRANLRFRFESISLVDNGNSSGDLPRYYLLGGGPKFGDKKGNIAVYLPVGFAFGEDIDISETWQLHPTLLFTAPISPQFEVNPSGKALIPLGNDSDVLVALNLGLGISSDLSRWAIRPEFGFLFNPGEEGRFFHWSIGFSLASD